jgi:hypothetical protein
MNWCVTQLFEARVPGKSPAARLPVTPEQRT